MSYDRLKAETDCIEVMKELDPSNMNVKMYQEIFKNMTDAEFHNFMVKMVTGEVPLSVNIPNYSKCGITVRNNKRLAESLGKSLMQRIWIYDPITKKRFLSQKEYLVCEANVSRQIQNLDHKISTAKDNTQIDERTGQPTGNSRPAQLSGPEMGILKSTNNPLPIIELIKMRGGDNVSMRYLDQEIIKSGSASMSSIPGQKERMAKSVKTMSIYLNGMMFKNNFAG